MKKLTLFFALTTLALGTICALQWRKLATQQTQLASLRSEAEVQTQNLEELKTVQQQAEAQRTELVRQTQEQAAQLHQAKEAAKAQAAALRSATVNPASSAPPVTKAEGDKTGFGNIFSKMMQDPEAKKFMRQQQRVMVEQLYTPLIKQLGLSSDEADKFKTLITDNMAKGAEKASSMFSGDAATNRAAMFSGMADEQKNLDQELKNLLGDTGFKQYQDYQQTVGERTQLNQFKQQLATDNPLSDQQTDALLALMKDEKKKIATTAGLDSPGKNQDQAKLEAMLSDDQTGKLMQSQETINQNVFQRARDFLSPEQLDAFGKFQTNQLGMMRMGMSMARKFLTPAKSDPAAGTSN
jgi:hypothetical protein